MTVVDIFNIAHQLYHVSWWLEILLLK